jgi:hypothetical protein
MPTMMQMLAFSRFAVGLAVLSMAAWAKAASVTLELVPGAVFERAPGETIDVVADDAHDAAALARHPGFAVIGEWKGFEGRGSAVDFSNFGLVGEEVTLRGRILFKNPVELAPWAGRATSRSEHPQKALNTLGDSAIILPGTGHMTGYELTFGSGEGAGFVADRAVRAIGFVIANIMPGETVRVEFYSRSGSLITSQQARGVALEGPAGNYQGQELFFGHVASADPAAQIHRVTVRLQASNQFKDWSLDALGFTPPQRAR